MGSERHISLLWSEEVLFRELGYKHFAALRRGQHLCLGREKQDTRLAKLLAKTDRDKSLSLLEDAVPEARRIEGLDPDRPRALLAIANALRLIEPSRTWDSLFEAVKAANSARWFYR